MQKYICVFGIAEMAFVRSNIRPIDTAGDLIARKYHNTNSNNVFSLSVVREEDEAPITQ